MRVLKKLLKGALVLLGLWVIVGLGLLYYGLSGAADRVGSLCTSIKPGTKPEDLRAFTKDHGFMFPEGQGSQDFILIAERRSGGRYGCKLALDHGVVESSGLYHVD